MKDASNIVRKFSFPRDINLTLFKATQLSVFFLYAEYVSGPMFKHRCSGWKCFILSWELFFHYFPVITIPPFSFNERVWWDI